MKLKYWRKGQVTGEFMGTKVDQGTAQHHKSINAAKRHSRELQKGALGRGSLVVIRG